MYKINSTNLHLLADVAACSDPGTPLYGIQHSNYSYEEDHIVSYECKQSGYIPEHDTIICYRFNDTQPLGWFVFDSAQRDRGAAVNTSNSGVRPRCIGEFWAY